MLSLNSYNGSAYTYGSSTPLPLCTGNTTKQTATVTTTSHDESKEAAPPRRT